MIVIHHNSIISAKFVCLVRSSQTGTHIKQHSSVEPFNYYEGADQYAFCMLILYQNHVSNA